MNNKDTMILEYNPKINQKHIYFIWADKPRFNPEWKNLGQFYGTMIQANKEIEKRVKLYEAENGTR